MENAAECRRSAFANCKSLVCLEHIRNVGRSMASWASVRECHPKRDLVMLQTAGLRITRGALAAPQKRFSPSRLMKNP
jgi:hypothetical protein